MLLQPFEHISAISHAVLPTYLPGLMSGEPVKEIVVDDEERVWEFLPMMYTKGFS